MRVKINVFYVIRPNNLLRETCKEYLHYDHLYFIRPLILTREEYWGADDSEILDHEEISEAKLTFLLDLVGWKDYVSELFEIIFGNPLNFSQASFDKWWTIERIDYEKSSSSIYDNASDEKLNVLQSNGDKALEKWLHMMKNGGYKAMEEEYDQLLKRKLKGK